MVGTYSIGYRTYICPRYNYLKIRNLRVQKKFWRKIKALRKSHLKLCIYVCVLHSLSKINVLYINGRKFTKYLHGT